MGGEFGNEKWKATLCHDPSRLRAAILISVFRERMCDRSRLVACDPMCDRNCMFPKRRTSINEFLENFRCGQKSYDLNWEALQMRTFEVRSKVHNYTCLRSNNSDFAVNSDLARDRIEPPTRLLGSRVYSVLGCTNVASKIHPDQTFTPVLTPRFTGFRLDGLGIMCNVCTNIRLAFLHTLESYANTFD